MYICRKCGKVLNDRERVAKLGWKSNECPNHNCDGKLEFIDEIQYQAEKYKKAMQLKNK